MELELSWNHQHENYYATANPNSLQWIETRRKFIILPESNGTTNYKDAMAIRKHEFFMVYCEPKLHMSRDPWNGAEDLGRRGSAAWNRRCCQPCLLLQTVLWRPSSSGRPPTLQTHSWAPCGPTIGLSKNKVIEARWGKICAWLSNTPYISPASVQLGGYCWSSVLKNVASKQWLAPYIYAQVRAYWV